MANPDILGIAQEPEPEIESVEAYAERRKTRQVKHLKKVQREKRYEGRMFPEELEARKRYWHRAKWKELVMGAIEESQAKNPDKLITVEPEVLDHPNCGIRISKHAKSGITSFPSNGSVPPSCGSLGGIRNSMVQRIMVAMLDKFSTVTLTQSVRINAAAKAYINGLLLNRKLCDTWDTLTPDQTNALLNGEARLTEKFADAMEKLGLDQQSTKGIAEVIAEFQAKQNPQPNITVNVLNQTGENVKPAKQSVFLEVPEDQL